MIDKPQNSAIVNASTTFPFSPLPNLDGNLLVKIVESTCGETSRRGPFNDLDLNGLGKFHKLLNEDPGKYKPNLTKLIALRKEIVRPAGDAVTQLVAVDKRSTEADKAEKNILQTQPLVVHLTHQDTM